MSGSRLLRNSQPAGHWEDRELERHFLLMHIAATCPADARELSRRLARPVKSVQEDLKELMQQGVVHVHEGALRTSAAQRLLAGVEREELHAIHDQILSELESGQSPKAATLIALADSGCTRSSLLTALIKEAIKNPGNTGALGALTLVARARGISEIELDLLKAQECALQGESDDALALTDPLLTESDSGVAVTAAKLAAGIHVRENRLARASALYRHIGKEHIGHESAWAVLAALGQGKLDEARKWSATLPNENLTNQDAGLVDFARGISQSVENQGSEALDLLARSIASLAPLGSDVFLPESPAAIAALVAIHSGEPATAEVLLKRALETDLSGETGRNRHLLFLGWAQMTQGRLKQAETTLAKVSAPDDLNERDQLLHGSLRAGIARRQSDFATMREAWREIRSKTFGISLTLYDLLPVGELLVIAARLRDTDRTSMLLEQSTTLLAGLGNPPIWATPLHWHAIQAAFQAEKPDALLPHATALVQAGKQNKYAAILAQAGNTWLAVLRRDVDFDSVKASVEALADNGHVWDAARLAGQAALQHPEREGALAMMQLAREVSKDQAALTASTPKSSTLTRRETEVARLVLDGQGYRMIGEQLFISPKTVEHHVARIKNRLGAASRADLLEKLHDLFMRTAN